MPIREDQLRVSKEQILDLILLIELKAKISKSKTAPRSIKHFNLLSEFIIKSLKERKYKVIKGTQQPDYESREVSVIKGQQFSKYWKEINELPSSKNKNIVGHGDEILLRSNFCNMLSIMIHEKLYLDVFGEVKVELGINIPENELLAEFPTSIPAFPATPTIPIFLDDNTKIFIKDESKNPTGTHKDRLAHEIVVRYKEEIKTYGKVKNISLITAGATGIALKYFFKKYNPNVRIQTLIDIDTPKEIEDAMKRMGCIIKKLDLSAREFNSKSIIKETNIEGDCIELTFGQEWNGNNFVDISYIKENFYDWLTYEIFNQNPDICFIPVGSGELMLNILKRVISINEIEMRRLFVPIERIKNCLFIGVTSNNKIVCEKLYSKYKNDSYKQSLDLINLLNEEKGFPIINSSKWQFSSKEYKKFFNDNSNLPNAILHLESNEKELIEKSKKIVSSYNIECENSGIIGLAAFLDLKFNFDSLIGKGRTKKVLVVNTGKVKLEFEELTY